MRFKLKRPVYVLLAAAFLAAACVPGQPVSSPTDTVDQVATSVAATVAAMQSATAGAASETPTPTVTLVPTATSFLPTATPFVITPPTSSSGGGGGGGGGSGGGSTSTKYSCAIVSEKPNDGAAFKPGDSFDKEWTIKNTGTETWALGWDFEYIEGTIMSPTTSLQISKQVKKGDTITIRIEMVAPDVAQKDSGKIFFMRYSLNNGSHFCTPYAAIRVFVPGDPNAP